ncbi:tubulin delta chain [Harpegnathos saltator]|uniref:Tubulin delta chain n=1 Tax=Harpegnathos saltator TaxID=610380 RepID=E2B5X5_HARSA|nr:tubulin delta chain [Harpegnathos saltator]EFN88944.1 Tubulin delta chain [Harpegnathos saltator]
MLTIQFGQCGNQLGYNLLSKVSTDLKGSNTGVSHGSNYEYAENTIEKWFDEIAADDRCSARAILVDTEEKVLSKISKETTTSWFYRSSNIICQCNNGGGSANNWAYGYCINGKQLSNAILNVTRRQIEKLDRFQGFLLLLSSAGGTGSGVGSRMVELLREEYITKTIIATIVLPFTFGEVCIQNYNTILTLAKFCSKADLSVLFENEKIYATCVKLLQNSSTALHDMNDVIAENLLAVFQPTNNARYNANSLVYDVAAHPNFKFATIKSTPYIPVTSLQYEPTHKWDVYIRHLEHALQVSKSQTELTNSRLKKASASMNSNMSFTYSSCVSNVLVTRGKSIGEDIVMTRDLHKKHLYPDWNTLRPFTHLHQERRILNRNKFLTLVTNNSEIHQPLGIYLDKAWNSYKCAAFLHQYKQFGCEEDDFLQAFAVVENIAQEYKNLKRQNGN